MSGTAGAAVTGDAAERGGGSGSAAARHPSQTSSVRIAIRLV
jgi:hypothetical protein